jgi:predicted RNase H-like HicB family nuclease
MRNIAQFKVSEDEGTYIAQGVDLAIVTQANTLDELVKNIEEAVSLYFYTE